MDAARPLQHVSNFRDVGETVNKFQGNKRVREGRFFRSARPDDATHEDRVRLTNEFGIQTIIDLRTKTEHTTQAARRKVQSATPALVEANPALAEPMQIAGIDYRETKLTGRPFERHLMSQLTWCQFLRFLFLFLLGYRLDAIRILGENVMLHRGLAGLAIDTIDHSTAEVREILLTYADATAMPSMVHCTQGKDRTGIVCALVLMILGVPIEAIEHDYFLTDEALIPEREERVVELRQIGLTPDWASTASDMIARLAQHIDTKYGNLENYLDQIGFGAEDRGRLREALLY